jgi:hypothetical protein
MIEIKPHMNFVGTSLQGYIDMTHAELVELFGEHETSGDGYKIDYEVGFMLVNGDSEIRVTIYNYKDGVNYNGEEDGIPTEEITDWHIGGDLGADEILDQYLKQEKVSNRRAQIRES